MGRETKIRIVCISDTHGHKPGEGYTLPKGDVLIHAGDLTNQGGHQEIEKAVAWLSKADFAVKIVVAGNHDLSLDPHYTLKHEEGWRVMPSEPEKTRALLTSNADIVYLQHSQATISIPHKGVCFRVFGSPYSPDSKIQNWAFQYENDQAEALWNEVTSGVDVLITHTPPHGFCDASRHWPNGGCPALTKALERVRPQLHVCGHCHEGRGVEIVRWPGVSSTAQDTWIDPGRDSKKQSLLDLTRTNGASVHTGGMTAIVNASIMARSYGHGAKQFNKPIVVDLLVPQDEVEKT